MLTITKQQSNYLKLIGIITMLIDHLGLILFPDLEILRIIGRISFPIFAYQLVVGYINTGNVKKYFFRLLGLGILFQIPFIYVVGGLTFNIFFTLAIGLGCIWLIDNKKLFPVVAIMLTTILLENYEKIIYFLNINSGFIFTLKDYVGCFDYGLYGLLTIITMYLFIENKKLLVFGIISLNAIAIMFYGITVLQTFAPLALLFICRPLNLKLKISGWFFYLFYPAHIVILYLIKVLWFS